MRSLKNGLTRVGVDLSKERQQGRRVQGAGDMYRRLFESVPLSVLIVQDNRIVLMTAVAGGLLGYSQEELARMDFLELLHPECVEHVRSIHTRRVAGKTVPECYETRILTRNGLTRHCQVHVRQVAYEGRQAYLVAIIVLDPLREQEDQAVQRRNMEALSYVASGLEQELGNFLSVLSGTEAFLAGHAAVQDPEGQHLRALVQRTRSAAMRLRHQLEPLAGLDCLPDQTQAVDLARVLDAAVARTVAGGQAAKTQGPPVEVKTYLRNLSPVKGDPVRLQEVFENILANAADAMPQGGQIYVSGEDEAGFARLYFQDSGRGIQADIRHRIFDPFFSDKGGDHLGLGLTQAFAVIHRHGGSIEAISREGEGTMVTVSLPLVPARDAQARVRRSRSTLNRVKVLGISPDAIVRHLMKHLLQAKGYEVAMAATPKEAGACSRKTLFDLILVDLQTTPSAAWVRQVRRLGRNGATDCIGFNASSRETPGAPWDPGDFAAWLPRPLEEETLMQTLDRVLRLRGETP